MSLRPEVDAVLALGRLPTEASATEEELRAFEIAIARIPEPITLDEARALATLFGRDDCYGLAWTLLHKIETCGAPVVESELGVESEWLHRLWRRGQRRGA